MIKKMNTNEGIQYQKLSKDEMAAHGILGRLIGPCADFVNPTRNGRSYSEQLWENVFNDPIMKEKIKNHCVFGELCHPADRTEIDMEKVAICLHDTPVKNDKGQLIAVFDILNTPNGKILKTMCDYGSTVAISSRGQGDIITDDNGNEAVDPDTYECECFDIVLVPGVESARLKYVTEGLDKKTLKLKKALKECLNNESEEGRKVMEETLQDLKLNVNEDKDKQDDVQKISITDCVEVTSAKQGQELVKKYKALWIFGNENDDLAARYFDLLTKDGSKIYVYENGKDTLAFSMKDGVVVQKPVDVKNATVKAEIVQPIANADEVTTENTAVEDTAEVTEPTADAEQPAEEVQNVEDTEVEETPAEDTELEEPAAEEETSEETEKVEEAKEEKVEDAAEEVVEEPSEEEIATEETIEEEPVVDDTEEAEVEETEEDTRSDADIFLDYLANNFDEDKIKEVCDILNIEVEEEPADDTAEQAEEATEETAEDKGNTEEEIPAVTIDDKDAENTDEKPVEEAIGNGLDTLVTNLKEALKVRSDLENNVKTLNEKLAVSDAKVTEANDECAKYKEAITRLSTLAKAGKDLKNKVSVLEESLAKKDEMIDAQKARITRLVNSRKENLAKAESLTEGLNTKSTELKSLSESLETSKKDYESKLATLNEQIERTKDESAKQIADLNENLKKATSIKESYKQLATKAVNKYIDMKADMLGLTSKDIKRKLGASYTLDDVDQVCENLKSYTLNVSRLPISVGRQMSVKVNEGKNITPARSINSDDDVDDTLISLANICD